MLKIENLTKSYTQAGKKILILDKINLEIGSNQIISISGSSGSGKTTLLNILGTLDKPDSGKIIIDNQEINYNKNLTDFRKSHFGFIFQHFYLLPNLTALENVLLPTFPYGTSKKVKAKALELLEKVGLENRINHRPNQLSGGEQQRVAIARSLINNPKVILADEPTGNLDTKNSESIFQLLISLCKNEGKSLILVTHDPRWEVLVDKKFTIFDSKLLENPKLP